MAARTRAALGLKVHTGWAAVVAVGRPDDAANDRETWPRILGKTRIDVAFTFDEGAVFHVGQTLPPSQASALVRDAEARFARRARAELAAFAAGLGAEIQNAVMAAAAAKALPAVEAILKSHALVHAAEGELYRRVFADAAAALGTPPVRVPPDALAARAAAAAGLTPARLTTRLAAMGKASGKPWTVDQKQATLAAWLALATQTAHAA